MLPRGGARGGGAPNRPPHGRGQKGSHSPAAPRNPTTGDYRASTPIQSRGLNVVDFADARAREISALRKAVSGMTGTRRVFQTLPRHMRRRAVSHDVRRLPARLREAAKRENVEATTPSKKSKVRKSESRKKRRNPSRLLERESRLSRSAKWLETHLWHSKRMKMTARWGYALALHPSDKNSRAGYSAVSRHCVLQDASYTACIEVVGDPRAIGSALSSVADTGASGFPVDAACYLQGARAGHALLHDGTSCIGPASFVWRQISAGEDERARQLWLWVHPACAGAALETMSAALLRVGGAPARPLFDELSFFRLRGPHAAAVVREALTAHASTTAFSEISAVWDALRAGAVPASLPSRAVLGVTVVDPRLRRSLVSGRRNLSYRSGGANTVAVPQMVTWPNAVSALPASSLWNADARAAISAAKPTDGAINARRSQLVLAGAPDGGLDPLPSDPPVPLLLVQDPGYSPSGASRAAARGRARETNGGERAPTKEPSAGFASGFDVVVPPGWAVPVWRALVFAGARAFGLRQWEATRLEMGLPSFPVDWPDSPAVSGRPAPGALNETMAEVAALTAAHNARPKAKRVNFAKMRVASPFRIPWESLCGADVAAKGGDASMAGEGDAADAVAYFVPKVLRDARALAELSQWMGSGGAVPACVGASGRALVCVRLSMTGRGVPLRFAHISLPMDAREAQGGATETVPASGKYEDPARRIVGYVTTGGFAQSRGHGLAIGFVLASALPDIARLSGHRGRPVVLVRNITSLVHWPAAVAIVTTWQ